MTMSQRSKLLVKRYLHGVLVAGVIIIVGHILASISTGVGKAIRDFGDWRAWKLVWLPAFVGGGLLMTLADWLELKLKHRHKKHRLNPSDRT